MTCWSLNINTSSHCASGGLSVCLCVLIGLQSSIPTWRTQQQTLLRLQRPSAAHGSAQPLQHHADWTATVRRAAPPEEAAPLGYYDDIHPTVVFTSNVIVSSARVGCSLTTPRPLWVVTVKTCVCLVQLSGRKLCGVPPPPPLHHHWCSDSQVRFLSPAFSSVASPGNDGLWHPGYRQQQRPVHRAVPVSLAGRPPGPPRQRPAVRHQLRGGSCDMTARGRKRRVRGSGRIGSQRRGHSSESEKIYMIVELFSVTLY